MNTMLCEAEFAQIGLYEPTTVQGVCVECELARVVTIVAVVGVLLGLAAVVWKG
jgi:hypothetical protein